MSRPFIKEMPFELFEGQIASMRLISNHICIGPCPEPEDEVEQHLSLCAHGRVFFSAYVYGEPSDGKYRISRRKQFKIQSIEAQYILSHIAIYFSRAFPIQLTLDVGDWYLEIMNTDGRKFLFTGSLDGGLFADFNEISFLLRKYLGMTDIFAFDGDARFPIVLEPDEYIFVNVTFDDSEKTYCYLCDDVYIQEGDEVLVPVGNEGDFKEVYVEGVELHTAEDAPFPIDRCKKVVRRV